MNLRRRSTLLGLTLLLFAAPAFADDLADEAELHFSIGASSYQTGDYGKALEHFLVSNRLVSNKNVVFNIARCFEQLGKFPEAFRYYDTALAAETEPVAIEAIRVALQRISGKVTILTVESDPPGATIYVERKDLGPRGATPRRLGLPVGRYTILVELPGYRPAQVTTDVLALGEQRTVKVTLSQILGEIRIGGEAGAHVVVDRVEDGRSCDVPCAVSVPPGSHALHVTRPHHEPTDLSVEVVADRPTIVAPKLARLNGSVVVSTDEANALVEVDGIPRGFTPAVVVVPVGEHRIRVSHEGFKTTENVVVVEPERQSRLAIELVASEQVQGASRRVESVEDTPSSVSIVSRQELAALAYPTVAEALRGLPGVFFWDDRGYTGIGMRGLGRLNSYGNRMLVLLDGVPMNDNWLGSAYVGYDLMTDLGNVERVELIRGPGSAVYGTSAFSGVVNIVTRPATDSGLELGASTNLDSVGRARARANVKWNEKSNLFASASIGRSAGREFYFPEYRTVPSRYPGTEPGWARGLDGMRSATLQGQINHGVFSTRWSWNRYQKDLPSAPFDTWFGDPRTRQTDERGFIELRADPKLSANTTSTSRFVLNRYAFRGVYSRPVTVDAVSGALSDGLEVDEFRGHWANFEQRLVHSFSPSFHLTVGGEGAYHFDAEQTARDARGYFPSLSPGNQNRYGVVAGYGILDAAIGSKLRMSLGGRVDHYSTFGTSFNPRVGLVARPYEQGNTKVNVGRAFRAPSIYELYYNDNGLTQRANPSLKPETMISGEIEHSHRLSTTVVATGGVYLNTVRGLIDTTGAGTSADPIQFVTTQNPLGVVGAEFGLRRDWRAGYMASLTYGYSVARMLADARLMTLLKFKEEAGFRNVANYPTHAATFKGVVPFLIRGVSLGTRMALEDRRWDRYELSNEPPQHQTKAAVIWDLVLTAEDDKHRVRGAFGLYNIFDWQYRFPVGSEYAQLRTMPSGGRSLLMSLEARL